MGARDVPLCRAPRRNSLRRGGRTQGGSIEDPSRSGVRRALLRRGSRGCLSTRGRRGQARAVMSTAIIAYRIDAAEYLAKSKAVAALPATIRTQVLQRGFRAVGRSSETQIVRKAAADTSMRQKDVRDRLKTVYSDHDVTHVVRSPWIPLAHLGGARQTRTGVTRRRSTTGRGAPSRSASRASAARAMAATTSRSTRRPATPRSSARSR